jgi:hypothetical protein
MGNTSYPLFCLFCRAFQDADDVAAKQQNTKQKAKNPSQNSSAI